MILVDTSIWISLLSEKRRNYPSVEQLKRVVTYSPIVQEVVQGISDPSAFQKIRIALLAFPRLSDPLDVEWYLQAADIFATGRRKGLTIRSSIDCLIAAIAIENRVPVWHADRDFDTISQFTALQTVSAIS